MKTRLTLVAAALFLVPFAAHAQGGCVNSPENPTALLALVGAAGAAFEPLRRRFFRR